MLPKWHILFGAIASVILFFFHFLQWQILIFFLSSFLIDADHYVIYAIKRKEKNLIKVYNAFKKLDKKQSAPNFKGKRVFFLCIFHTYEFLFLFSILAISCRIAFFILMGFLFHILTDITFSKDRKSYLKAISICYHIKKNIKKRKNFGELRIWKLV